jgi:apolipoprotein N-acyltransferase
MASLQLGVTPRDGLCAAAFGALGAAAFPPLGLWPLSIASVCLLLVLLKGRPIRESRNLGLVYGFANALGTMYWLFSIFSYGAIALIAIMAAYWGLLATLVSLVRGYRSLAAAALVALFAVGVEWLRGDAWYLRFPWYTIPHALAAAPFCIASVRWLGCYGLSYLIWLIAAWGAFRSPLIWLAFALLPAAWLFLPATGSPDRQALLLQAEDSSRFARLIEDASTQPVDVCVLPEYAYYFAPERVLDDRRGPAALARKTRAVVVFGAVEGNLLQGPFQNVAAVIGGDGRLMGTFPKQRPLPLFKDGTPGKHRPVFPAQDGVLGVGICYDFDAPAIAASLVRNGATVFVDPTFDSIDWGRVQHEHHELLLRLRAVENDRWILRAASSGRSEAIDPRGVPSTAGVAIGETGASTVPFAHRTGVTLGGQASLMGPAAAAGTVLFVALAFLSSRRARPGKPAPQTIQSAREVP